MHARSAAALKKLIVMPGGHHRSIQHDAELQGEALRFVKRARELLSRHCADVCSAERIHSEENLSKVSVVGVGMRSHAGVALTMKMEGKDSVCIAYFGEGASNTGDFHEATSI